MERGISVPLSPNEEVTLRRVALGLAARKDLRTDDLTRLTSLRLVEELDGRPVLTDIGRRRYQALPKAANMTGIADMREFIATFKQDLGKGRDGR